MTAEDIILTGAPRSGTTLTCHLLNRLPQVVALHEPMQVFKLSPDSAAERVAAVAAFFAEQRASLLARGTALSKLRDGGVPDNSVSASRNERGLRVSGLKRSQMQVEKELRPGFRLVLKHPTAFTAMLPELSGRYPCFAVVRNPLGVLASWNSVNMAVNRGHAPAAERLRPDLKARLAALPQATDRQLALLDWLFAEYAKHLPRRQVLLYEQIVSSGGGCLSVIAHGAAESPAASLDSKNANPEYDRARMRELAERLLASEGAYWEFYSRSDIESLAEA